MKITRDNYEPYFLDYLEGKLDENLVDDFLEFLKQNPDLKEELSMIDMAPLEPEIAFFSKKENLYKQIYDSEKEFNHAAIALIEGDISKSEKTEFEEYLLKHPEKQKEVQRFQQTKLQPDKTVVFAHKNKLYRRTAGKTIFLWASRVAAVLVLAMAIYFTINQNGENIVNENQVALVETEPTDENVSQQAQKPPVDTGEKKAEPTEIIPNNEKQKLVKTKETVPEPAKNLSETTRKRMDHENIAEAGISVEVPEKIERLAATIQPNELQNVSLAHMTITFPETHLQSEEEKFFADVVKEKTGLDNFSFRKITKAGLNLVSSISKENFNYETNEEGKVTELNFESRLLAFSIPTNNDPIAGE